MVGQKDFPHREKFLNRMGQTFNSRIMSFTGCTRRQAEVYHETVQAKADLFQRITATGVTNEKQNNSKHFSPSSTAWSETGLERYFEFARKSAPALKLAETPCMDDHQFLLEGFNSTKELALVCAPD